MAAQYAIVADVSAVRKLFVAQVGEEPPSFENPVWGSVPALFPGYQEAENFRQFMIGHGRTEAIRAAAVQSLPVPIGYVIAADKSGYRCLGGDSPAFSNASPEHWLVFNTNAEALEFRNRTPIAFHGHVVMIVRV